LEAFSKRQDVIRDKIAKLHDHIGQETYVHRTWAKEEAQRAAQRLTNGEDEEARRELASAATKIVVVGHQIEALDAQARKHDGGSLESSFPREFLNFFVFTQFGKPK